MDGCTISVFTIRHKMRHECLLSRNGHHDLGNACGSSNSFDESLIRVVQQELSEHAARVTFTLEGSLYLIMLKDEQTDKLLP